MAAKRKNKEAPEEEVPLEQTQADCEQAVEEEAAPEAPAEPSLEEELAAEREKHLRLYAEYENFRKRSAKEREQIYGMVKASTITSFLPVYDNLSRALRQPTEDEAYRKGVEMTMAQLKEILEKLGVSEIPALGETFDPELHNAVMHTEDEEKAENEIVEEFEKGFKLGDKVIRFSMVKVAN